MTNFVIWRARILTVLDEYDIKDHTKNVITNPTDVDPLKKFNENQARAKRLIMDGVKDHVVLHIAGKNTTNEMWTNLNMMYQGSPSRGRCFWRIRCGCSRCRRERKSIPSSLGYRLSETS